MPASEYVSITHVRIVVGLITSWQSLRVALGSEQHIYCLLVLSVGGYFLLTVTYFNKESTT